jgi:phosphorylase kinase alpha/beta subunit
LVKVLERYSELESLPQQLEQLSSKGDAGRLSWSEDLGLSNLKEPQEGWLSWRQHRGIIDRRPKDFYKRTWQIFRHVPCLVIGDKLDRKNRIESGPVISDMTPGEKSFALLIEHLLNRVIAPEYRQLTIETLSALSSFFEQNGALMVTDALYADAIIGHAVRLFYLQKHPERAPFYLEDKVVAWTQFYAATPLETSHALVEALRHLLGASHALSA